MTTDSPPTRRRKHKTARPAAGAGRASTSVYQTSSGWLITHRGESLPGYGTVGHDGPALLGALTSISREITASEMRVRDRRARHRAAQRPLADHEQQSHRVERLTGQLRRVNTTVLLRRAARTLRPTAPRAVIRQPNDGAVIAVLREETALAVHDGDLLRAVAARTLELAGAAAARDAAAAAVSSS
ncbi:MAG TPA: hypothetical protein VGO80_06155 [Solirubrobacteraceae bacterium]|jgi:hypothetical protein|nr:hypothetical protein [Solirubrobacteraceae bacterium]